MWTNIRLRTRIILGYIVVLALVAALLIVLMARIQRLSAQIARLNDTSTLQVASAERLVARYVPTQLAVTTYLLQPNESRARSVLDAVGQLDAQIALERPDASDPNGQVRYAAIARQVEEYRGSFETLSLTMTDQGMRRAQLIELIADANVQLRLALERALSDERPDPPQVRRMTAALGHLQVAQLRVGRLVAEPRREHSEQALAALQSARSELEGLAEGSDPTLFESTDATLVAIDQSLVAVPAYISTTNRLQLQRNELLTFRADRVRASIVVISEAALREMNTATNELETQSLQTQQFAVGAMGAAFLLAIGLALILSQTITRPLREMVAATKQINEGNLDIALKQTDLSEVGQLSQAFNQMAVVLKQQRAEGAALLSSLTERNLEMERTLSALKEATDARAELETTVRTLHVPVIPILANVILVPLVGEIDTERAETLVSRILDGVTDHSAHTVILDITGVPIIDRAVANTLITAARSVRLLGAESVLVGVGPEVAQTLVGVGADLQDMRVWVDLRSAVEATMRRNGRAGVRSMVRG